MTLHMFGQHAEVPANVASVFPDVDINNAQDSVRQGTTDIVLDRIEAPTIIELPERAQPHVFGTFEAFAAAIMDPNNRTYDLDTNSHL